MAGMQREIGIIIRVKEAAAAKQAIKDIVDKQILDHIKKLNLQLKDTGEGVDKLGKKAREVEPAMDSFFKGMLKGTGILYTLKRSMGFAMDSFEKGAGLERAAHQFESSIGKIGDVLPQLRAATRGTVEDMKLLETANRAVIEGLNPKQLTKMYQMATVASRKLGLGTEQSIQTISNAIVRQDESALTTLGTILKTNIGLKVQGALIAKNGGVMSGAMAVAIRQSVIMSELNSKFGGFNDLQEDSVEVLERFRSSMANLKVAVGQTLGTALSPLLKVISSLANAATDFLNSVKDTAGFKTFVQYLTTLGAIFAGKGLISSIIRTVKYLGLFVGGLKAAAVVAGGTIAFKALGFDISDIGKSFETAGTAASVFFQLLTNYNSETGLSSVLTKDKEALGGLYDAVFSLVKVWKVLEAAGSGFIKGFSGYISKLKDSIITALGPLGPYVKDLLSPLMDLFNSDPLKMSFLRSVTNAAELLGKVLGFIVTALPRVVGFFAGIVAPVDKLVWLFTNLRSIISLILGDIPSVVGTLGNIFSTTPKGSQSNPTSQTPTASIDPSIRQQNVDFLTQGSPELSALLKEAKATKEANERMDARDEQRKVKEDTTNAFSTGSPFSYK